MKKHVKKHLIIKNLPRWINFSGSLPLLASFSGSLPLLANFSGSLPLLANFVALLTKFAGSHCWLISYCLEKTLNHAQSRLLARRERPPKKDFIQEKETLKALLLFVLKI